MDFESIQAFLQKAVIPKIKRQPKTFMVLRGNLITKTYYPICILFISTPERNTD